MHLFRNLIGIVHQSLVNLETNCGDFELSSIISVRIVNYISYIIIVLSTHRLIPHAWEQQE